MTTQCPKCQTENPDTLKFCGECGTQLTPVEESQPSFTKTLETPVSELSRGALFADRYEIIEELGSGGMGKVYRVEDTKTKEEIAVKLIRPEVAANIKTIERFRNELTTARKIRHKNVCGMYDLGEFKGLHYISMEYVSGEDLKSLVRRVTFDKGTAIKIAIQVLEGLAEAHRLGVVHRDLKPSNIMIDQDGNARIMDFGIARSLEAKGITGAGVMIGTPEYMSPEQVEGKEVDQRSDIYSLGVILYEMMTGRVPFEGDTPFTIGMKHKGETPKNPKELNTQISDDLSSVILRCLDKDKAERYQNTGELKSELENIEKGIPTTERVVSERKPFTSKEITVQFSVRKLFIPALIFIAVVIIGLIIWKFLPKEKAVPSFPSDKPSLAVVYFMNQTGDETLDHWREALPRWIITDLSQSKYINVLPADRLFSVLRNLNLLETRNYASEDLKNVAKEGRVDHIFQASFSKAGDIFRIDYTLQKGDTLEIIVSNYVTGKNEESFPSLVDDITKKIKTDLELSDEQVASDIDENAGTITSNSPEAFRYYSIGAKFHAQAEYRLCIELMERAIAIDPEFALAYRTMATAYYNLSYRTKARELLKKALEFKDRLPDRERYRVEADFYVGSEITYDKAIEAYEKFLEIYPDERGARNNLAVIYRNVENYQKSIEHYEICINKYRTSAAVSYTGLAVVYRRLGLYDKAKETLEIWLNNLPDNASIRRSLANTYREQGKYDLALEEMDKAFALTPTYWLNIRNKGDIYYYMGDFKKAEVEYRKLLAKEEPVSVSWGTQRLGYLCLLEGKFEDSMAWQKKGMEQAEKLGETGWVLNRMRILADMDIALEKPDEALKKLDIAWKSAVEDEDLIQQRTILNKKALAYLEMKQTAEAQRTAEELKEIIEQGVIKNHIRLYYHLIGKIERAKGNYTKAINFFKKGLPFLFVNSGLNIIYADSLGQAYYESGDLEKALKEYEMMDSLPIRIANGDVYAKSFYMLGKIYEQQGNTAKTIENYEKFLTLWKDADPGITEVEDAKQRLAGLKGNDTFYRPN